MKQLRHKLILLFFAAVLVPTTAILWMSVASNNHILGYAGIDDLDRLSKSLQEIARNYYQESGATLKKDIAAGALQPERFTSADLSRGPAFLQEFWDSKDQDRFELSQPDGDRLNYLVRRGPEIWVYSRSLNGVRMEELYRRYREARTQVEKIQQRDLRRGFAYTLTFLAVVIWVPALASVVYMANRISRPIQGLTAGLRRLAGGDFEVRLDSQRQDEIGLAVQAFNHTAGHLQQSRDRLVYLTQIASWQTLARKMAHELKNSLTPIRLTVEEILARSPEADRQFLEQATQVVTGEVESLERRVRSFSEFAAEPQITPCRLNLNSLVEERVRFLEVAHAGIRYQVEVSSPLPTAWADPDQVKGILTNLLENAAEAAGEGGTVRAITKRDNGRLLVEVHDSGPGLSEEARRSLFEPSISFKKHGMGLGLSISRKNALMAGGDLRSIEGLLGGAGFRLTLPVQEDDHAG